MNLNSYAVNASYQTVTRASLANWYRDFGHKLLPNPVIEVLRCFFIEQFLYECFCFQMYNESVSEFAFEE